MITAIPKLLESMNGPNYFDEKAHFHELRSVIATGHLFQPNSLVPIAARFPGIEAATAAVHFLSGLSAWQSALLIVFIAHCLGPLIVFLIAECVGLKHPGPAIAAFVFMSNPSYMFFDDQYAYESLAIAFVLFAILCELRARSQTPRSAASWFILGLISGLAAVVTHHLSSLFMVVVLLLVAVFVWPKTTADSTIDLLARTKRHLLASLVGMIAAGLTLWIVFVAPSTYSYLSPFLSGGLSELGAASGVTGSSTAGATRQLLASPQFHIPGYEAISLFASPLVLALICAAAGYLWFRSHRIRRISSPLRSGALRRVMLPLLVIAALYFLSLPLDLTPAGSAGAHRSWAFTFAFVGLVIGWCVETLVTIRSPAHKRSRHWLRTISLVVIVVAIATVFVGNVPAGSSVDQRFPGPYLWGSDSWETTDETQALISWINLSTKPSQKIFTDRFTGEDIYAATPNTVSPGDDSLAFPLMYSSQPIPIAVWKSLQSQGYQYIIVDDRLTTHLGIAAAPFFGSLKSVLLLPSVVDRFEEYPWINRVYQSPNYSVYYINYSILSRREQS